MLDLIASLLLSLLGWLIRAVVEVVTRTFRHDPVQKLIERNRRFEDSKE
jgi:hypothetical protein